MRKIWSLLHGITTFILCIVTLTKGLKHIGLHLNGFEVFLISLIGIISIVVCYFISEAQISSKKYNGTFGGVEVFSILMLLTAYSMAFA